MICIELKYWTRGLSYHLGDEDYTLSDRAAQDLGRYDFIKDIERVERVVLAGHANAGCVVALTNDQGYWNASTRDTVDAAFRLHEGRSPPRRTRLGGTSRCRNDRHATARAAARTGVPLPLGAVLEPRRARRRVPLSQG